MLGTLGLAAVLLISTVPSVDAAPVVFRADLSGPAEDPPNTSPGTGTARVVIDRDADTMRVQITFSGLLGETTVAHIHAPTDVPFAGIASVATQTPTFSGFPAGVMSGTYDMTFDLSDLATYNASYVAANGGTAASAEAALFADIRAGLAYVNVHSTQFGGGEIRGFLTPAPAALGLLASALGGLAWVRRRSAARAG
jgi:hypothetical protein